MAQIDHTTRTSRPTAQSGGSTLAIGLLIGALVVAVAVLGFTVYSGGATGTGDELNISIDGAAGAMEQVEDAVNNAGAALEGAAESAEGN